MPQRLLHTPRTAGLALEVHGRSLLASHEQIVNILRSRLGQAHGDLLAVPKPDGDGVAWSTALGGDAVLASTLPPEEREKIDKRAQRLLNDIRGLGQQLAAEGSAAQMVGEMVERAGQVPSGDWLFSVGGKPVLVLWGHADAARPPVPPAPPVAPVAPTPPQASATAAAAPDPAAAAAIDTLGSAPGAGAAPAAASPSSRRWLWSLLLLPLLAALLFFGLRGCQDRAAPADDLSAKLGEAQARNKALEEEIARKKAQAPQFMCVRPPPEEPAPAASAPVAAASEPEPPASVAKAPPPADCPGQRPATQAPQVAIVFDTSPSMNYSLNASLADIKQAERQQQQADGMAALGLRQGADPIDRVMGEPRRITPAREAATTIARNLPPDVGAALVLVDSCRDGAKPQGYFGPEQRGALVSRLRGLRAPKADQTTGTPLADGIARAARMVDGVKRDAMMLVISDGEESCRGDPCAAAAAIARSKPRLRIDVLDITGTGAGNCVARATGGKVFTARNAREVATMMNRAAQDAMAPAACR